MLRIIATEKAAASKPIPGSPDMDPRAGVLGTETHLLDSHTKPFLHGPQSTESAQPGVPVVTIPQAFVQLGGGGGVLEQQTLLEVQTSPAGQVQSSVPPHPSGKLPHALTP